MTDEEIRAEIEMRLIPENECIGLCPTDKGRQYAYREVLYIIDSMQQKSQSTASALASRKSRKGVLGEMTEEEALEAEIDRWYDDEASKEFEQVLWADTCNCARHFAAWQREQMMKNAVDGKVHESVDPDSVWVVQDGWVSSKERGLVAGDRVKLIIIKD